MSRYDERLKARVWGSTDFFFSPFFESLKEDQGREKECPKWWPSGSRRRNQVPMGWHEEVKGTVKEDRRQYTGDITHNMDGDVVGVHQIWGGKCSSSLPNTKVQQKYPSIKFSVSLNHWANLTNYLEGGDHVTMTGNTRVGMGHRN